MNRVIAGPFWPVLKEPDYWTGSVPVTVLIYRFTDKGAQMKIFILSEDLGKYIMKSNHWVGSCTYRKHNSLNAFMERIENRYIQMTKEEAEKFFHDPKDLY